MYYEVRATKTCKSVGHPNDHYYTYDKSVEGFATIAEVKAHLREQYGTCKRTKIYRDLPDGSAKHVGYVYHFNSPKASYDDTAKHNQDWVEVNEIKSTPIIVR